MGAGPPHPRPPRYSAVSSVSLRRAPRRICGSLRVGSQLRWLTQVHGIAYNTIVLLPRVVLDTNVWVAALRSKRGASARLLSLIGTGSFVVVLSVPLLLEYEAVFLRDLAPDSSERQTREDILDYLCAVAERQEIFFLWRPHLRDPKDEMVLEAAVAGGCGRIVSFNQKDFMGAERFGVVVRTPREFLEEIGAVS